MKKNVLMAAALATLALAGCANQQPQQGANEQQLLARVEAAERAAAEARAQAAEAQRKADECMQRAAENDRKVDRAFKKSQQK